MSQIVSASIFIPTYTVKIDPSALCILFKQFLLTWCFTKLVRWSAGFILQSSRALCIGKSTRIVTLTTNNSKKITVDNTILSIPLTTEPKTSYKSSDTSIQVSLPIRIFSDITVSQKVLIYYEVSA